MRSKPRHWLQEWLKWYRVKILESDRVVKENRIECVSSPSTLPALQDLDTMNQIRMTEGGAEMKTYSKRRWQIHSPVDL